MEKLTEKDIKKLLDGRDALIDFADKVNSTKEEEENVKSIDDIQEKITKSIKNYFDFYEIDFILETFTRFGAAPMLIYDDNGRFAVSDTSSGPVAFKKVSGTYTVWVEKKMWKRTIRKAVKYWIFNLG